MCCQIEFIKNMLSLSHLTMFGWIEQFSKFVSEPGSRHAMRDSKLVKFNTNYFDNLKLYGPACHAIVKSFSFTICYE